MFDGRGLVSEMNFSEAEEDEARFLSVTGDDVKREY